MVITEREGHRRDKKGGFKEDCGALSLAEPTVRHTVSSMEKW